MHINHPDPTAKDDTASDRPVDDREQNQASRCHTPPPTYHQLDLLPHEMSEPLCPVCLTLCRRADQEGWRSRFLSLFGCYPWECHSCRLRYFLWRGS